MELLLRRLCAILVAILAARIAIEPGPEPFIGLAFAAAFWVGSVALWVRPALTKKGT